MASISPIQAARCCAACNFQMAAGITATILAISGVAISIFMGLIWAAVGFALLGALALFMSIQGAANNKELQVSVQRLQTVDRALNGQLRELRQSATALKSTMDQLHAENSTLKEAERKWEAQETALNGQISLLRTQKQQLESDLNILNSASGDLQKQIQAFLTNTLEMGKAAGVFEQSEAGIAATREGLEKTIESLNQGFKGNLTELAAHMETAKAATETIFKHLSDQQARQKTQLTQLIGLNQSFRSSESSLEAESRRLKEEWESIQKKTEELEKIQKNLSETEACLSQEKQSLQEQYLKLQEMEKAIQEASSRLASTPPLPHGALDSTRKAAAEVLAKTIFDREGQLKAIESKIRDKLAKLHKIKVELDQAKKP